MFDKRLLQLVPEARAFVALAVLCKWVALIAYIVLFVKLGAFLGAVAQGAVSDVAFTQWLVVSIVAVIMRFIASAAGQYAASKAAAKGKAKLRQEVYDKLVRLGPSYKEHLATNQAVSICGEGAEKLEVYLGQYLPQLFFAVLAPFTLFVVVFPMSWLAAVVLLVCVPLIPVSIVAIMRIAKRVMGAYWDSYVDLGSSFLEAVSGLTTLKVFRADERKQDQMAEEAEGFRVATMRLLRVQLNSVTVMDFFTYGGAALGIVIVLAQFLAGGIGLGQALTIMLLAVEFFLPMRILGSFFHTAMGAATVLDQTFELLDTPEPVCGGARIESREVGIECEGLRYSYGDRSGGNALDGLDFSMEPNTFLGITGESGSGKSTLAGILSGTYLGYEGSVRVGGLELRDIAPDSLHAAITYIPASSYVFKGSFRTNLMIGNRDANDYDMWNALGQCHLDDFVLQAGGLDAPVAEGGANLSGGQRQRLAMARALLRDTPIYIFDEVTSNVDADSEREMLVCIQRLALRKTVILISHRLSALAWADDILVLSAGKVVEQGTHGRLAAADGPYARLWSQQERFEQLAARAEKLRASVSRADGEADDADVPSAMAAALEKMPPSIAAATRSIMKGARIRALVEGGEGGMPAGHPSDIPLPESDVAVAVDADPNEDGRIANDEALDGEATDAVDAKLTRSVAGIVSGLMRIYGKLAPLVVRSTVLAVLGFLAAIAMVVAGIAAALGHAGLMPTLPALPAVVIIVACGVLRGFLRYGERLISHDETFQTLAHLRDRVFGHMRTLAPAKLEGRDTGDLISLLTGDIELLEVFYAHTISPVLVAVVVSLAVVVAVGTQSLLLALTVFICFLIVGVALPFMLTKWTSPLGRQLKDRTVRFGSFMYESLAGLPETLQFGCADLRRDELGGRMGALAGNEASMSRRRAVSDALVDALALASYLAVAAVACTLAAVGALSGGSAALCAALVSVSFEPVIAVARLGSSLHQTLASGSRVLDFLEEEPQTPEVVEGVRPTAFTGASVEDVTFSYGEEVILEDIDLDIAPGSVLHVAGPSGAGKSTLCKLLMRFWDAQQGRVSVSGEYVANIQTDALRGLEGYMTQTTHLFGGTIRDNIVLVKPDASDGELSEAVRKASLTSLIERLPEGLDTQLGEVGEGLSEGERQRIGLARVFLYDAPFLLLDEPTSNLDSLNEAAVLDALDAERAGKTMVVVSHRMSAAALADATYVVDQGRLS